MDWSKWKRYYGVKLRVAAFIFGIIGWFLLFVSIFGSHFEQQLLGLEKVAGSTTFTIGIKVLIFTAIISIVKFQNVIIEKLEERQMLFSFLRKAYATAVFGCIFWIIILLI
ncbi:MAG: hypothetical protein K8R13_11385 [Methanococcoides sp.]|nr:hypothetical protein [Methanococcoides sp.]